MMKTYIFKHSLLGVIVGLSILGCTEGDKFDYNKNVAFITGTETTPVTKFVVEDTPSSYAITASTTDKVDKDVNVKFAIDRSLVESYNQEHNTKYYAIPDGAAVLENADAVIQAGKAFSTPVTVKVTSTEDFAEGRVYVIPVTMTQVEGLDILKPSKTIFLQISRVIHFTSLNISNTNLYSNFIFSDDKKQELSNFTYEIKCYSQEWHRIARLCSFTSADEQRSSMLRFGENGLDINALQWVSPSGSANISVSINISKVVQRPLISACVTVPNILFLPLNNYLCIVTVCICAFHRLCNLICECHAIPDNVNLL